MTESRARWFEAKVPPPVLGLSGLLLQHRLAPASSTGWVRRSLAAGLLAGSTTLVATAARSFGRHRTTLHPHHPEQASTLVVDGPHAVTRNPMYLGLGGVLAAHALARGGLLTWLPVLGFKVALDRVQIAPEERALRELFGEEYDAYRSSVPRWLL